MDRRVIAIVIGSAVLAAAALSANRGIKRAEELFRRKDYGRARSALAADTSSMDRSTLAAALLLLARIETDYAKAEMLYRRVLASEDKAAAGRARLELASMRYATGDYAAALDLLSATALEGSDRDVERGAFFAALCRAQLGDDAGAAAGFERITHGVYAPWSMLARAEIDSRAGRLPAAMEKYESASRSGRHPGALFRLGECFERLGERDKALDTYRALIREHPRSFETAKANEKIQLLTAAKGKARDDKQPGGSEPAGTQLRDVRPGAGERRTYTIQFGSFETKANALAVAGKLEGTFRGVRVERFEHEGRVMHRVRVGMYENRESAVKDIERAKERLGLSGAIIPLQ